MTTRPTIENEDRRQRILAGDTFAKSINQEDGLFIGQRLSCANHAHEEIALDKIGWKHFICPKCGRDYSIGRKIVILE